MPSSLPLKRRNTALIAAFWAFYALVIIGDRFADPAGAAEPRLARVALIALSESLCWLMLTPWLFQLAGLWDSDAVPRTRSVITFVAVGAAIALALGLVKTTLRDLLIPGYAHPRLWFVCLNAFVVYLGVLAAGRARAYSLRYLERRRHAERLQAELAQVQLDALRRQLDPHFLFNTLNAVSTLVERDPAGVRRMIARLGDLLRHSLDGADEPEIPLRQELALLECYLDIMQVRFQGRLSVSMHVDDRTLDCLVPSLILQPLVENAIRHGVERGRGVGRIEIGSDFDGETVTLSVRDNGPGVGELTSAQGVGLRNTVARLDRLYGSESRFTSPRFTLRPAAEGGAVAEVQLPFRPPGRAEAAYVF